MFTGTGTALVTPFRADGSLDETTLRRLVQRQIDAGTTSWFHAELRERVPRSHTKSTFASLRSPLNLPKGKVPVLAGRAAITRRK